MSIGSLALAAGAGAETTVIQLPRGYDHGDLIGSVMVGSDLVTVDGNSASVLSPSGTTSQLSLTASPSSSIVGWTIAGSASDFAALESEPYGTSRAPLLAGPIAGPLTNVDPCAAAEDEAANDDLSLDGDNVAYIQSPCAGGPNAVVVRNLASGAAPTSMPLPGAVPAEPYVSLAGDYVGYYDGTDVIVRNWTNGSVIYDHAPLGTADCAGVYDQSVEPPGGGHCLTGLEVGSDGSLWEQTAVLTVVLSGTGKYSMNTLQDTCTGEIDLFAPGSTSSQPIGTGSVCGFPGDEALEPHVSGDSVVYDTHTGWIAQAAGGAPRALGYPGQIYSFSGTTLVTEHSTCIEQSIVSISTTSDPPLAADPTGCPVDARGDVTLGRHPYLSLRISCPQGCLGPLAVYAGSRAQAASSTFTLAPGASTSLRIALPPHGVLVRDAARLIASESHPRVSLAILALGPGGDPSKPYANVYTPGGQLLAAATVRLAVRRG
jgi:hypothetical protein